MPAVALSRVGARVVESGPGGQDLVAGAWQRLEALPDPRSPRGRIYPLACLIAIALCAFTAAGNDRFTAVGQWIRRASQQERPMPYVRDSFWRGREFASLEGMQAEAERWSLEVAGRRACLPLEGAAPAAVFEAVERDALRPLRRLFVLATWATAKIGPDIHAQVEKVLYSVPWRHIGKTADVRITGSMVQFFIGGQLVKSHPRKARGKQTDFGDITLIRRSRSTCGPRPGAAGRPPGSARRAST